jgi:hypothetical protein
MAVSTFQRFDQSVEAQMRNVYQTLSEKDQRRFAAIQARQLGHGGSGYIAAVLGCSTRTIRRGMDELDTLPDDPAAGRSGRRTNPPSGCGSKKKSRPARTLNAILRR